MVFLIHLLELVNGPGDISFCPGLGPIKVWPPRARHMGKMPILVD
jgi:hypothetical protein